ncbi:MAG: serine/threonine-protein kinase [Phycisphaerae bacterium]|nr:serine/threonine-protein kinase [Phycisphaerae bacterium]
MAHTATSWFEDPEQVLATLRAARRTDGPRLPTIAGYADLRELKRGGQGVVYTAIQSSTHRRVAIKLLSGGAASSERARRRFEREIDLAATLDHPNIVRIYDSGRTADGAPYFVMEFIEGVALDALFPRVDAADRPIERGAITQHIERFIEICDAVAYAHQRGVIHRDLKPSNIRVDPAGTPHVLDFGLAKALGEDESNVTQVSMTGEFLGSLPWASPEQVDGDMRHVDVRTDVYSLGVMLHQSLTGRFPYPVTGSFRTVLDTIVKQQPAPARRHNPHIAADLEVIIGKCLEKDAARRYQSVGDLALDLRRFLSGDPIEARRDSGWYTLRKTMWRYRGPVGVALSIFALSIASAVALGVLYQRAKVAEAEATQSAQTATSINKLLKQMLSTPYESGREARVADVIDEFASQLDAETTLQPGVEHGLRVILSGAYGGLGDYAAAQRQLDRASSIATTQPALTLNERSDALSTRAWVEFHSGRLEDAIRSYQAVLAELQTRLPADDTRVLNAKNDLALVLDEVGRSADAKQLLEETLQGLRHRAQTRTAAFAATLGNLASVNHSLGLLEEAERLFREQQTLNLELLGPDHRDTLASKSNLSVLLLDLGRTDEALQLCQVVAERRERMLGPAHRETLMALNNMAQALRGSGRVDEAQSQLRLVYDRALRALGADHPATLFAQGNLADALADVGEIEEAEGMTREGLERRERVFGPLSPSTLSSRNNLATVLMRQNLNNEALEIIRATVQDMKRLHGDDHILTATAKQNLASCYSEIGFPEVSLPLIAEVYATRLKHLGPQHFETLAARHKEAHFELDRGQPSRAAARFRALIPDELEHLGHDNLLTTLSTTALARALLECGEFDEAMCLFDDALETHLRLFGPEHVRTERLLGFISEAKSRIAQVQNNRAGAPSEDRSPAR